MRRDRNKAWVATHTEQLFQNVPVSGRDVDVANFYARKVGEEGVDRESLADLLAAYRAEQEEKLEDRIAEAEDMLSRYRRESDNRGWEDER